ncbi:hypothetical protein ILUMI_01841 [Ignelater luminosus]|uniref:Transposase n=1 Tax=Ignelater luminosus TaxID=2038154 RepID=A0A8K0DEK3_IGNLU|nr:hypothetical protein ILUMI_01841 [Ignelater luminosus]
MMEKMNVDQRLLQRILFFDEVIFYLNREVNSQNCRYWSRQNLHLYRATRTQRLKKVNVWAGLIGEYVVGSFFIDGNIMTETYLQILQERVIPELNQLDIEGEIWYQHDGAPEHNARNVRQ